MRLEFVFLLLSPRNVEARGTWGESASWGVRKSGSEIFAEKLPSPSHTMVDCNLRRKQLQQGEHLKTRCKLWAPTWKKEMGWAPEAG